MQQSSSRRGAVLALVSVVLVWSLVVFLWVERQAVYDWWRLRGYEAPSEIAALADNTTMNDSARRVFYVYHPQLEPAATFNEHCRDGEFTIVLGCYSAGRGIYIFRVDDPRLEGIEEVTAAHEFLHAAYDRLSKDERSRVDRLTTEVYQGLDNERLQETVAEYQKHDASVVPNELHSIIGTEVRDLPQELERYYAKYFTNRKQIVAYSEAYEAAFNDRKALAKRYETKLQSLKEEVETENEALEAEQQRLQNEAGHLEHVDRSANAEIINLRINQYNEDVALYNARVRNVSAMVDEYNNLYEKYKEIVLEQQDLFKAIDSRPQQIQ
jgi:hypothetical protein